MSMSRKGYVAQAGGKKFGFCAEYDDLGDGQASQMLWHQQEEEPAFRSRTSTIVYSSEFRISHVLEINL